MKTFSGFAIAVCIGAFVFQACGDKGDGCTPDCSGKCCGPDGCGGTCPDKCTDTGQTCNAQTCECEEVCQPDCQGRVCGTDGCGGTCPPGCESCETCRSGDCVAGDDSLACDDGLYCNGEDTCDGLGSCSVHAGSPCVLQTCDEDLDICIGPFVQVMSGGAHTCGLTSRMAAYCWGSDGFGQLGNGDLPVNDCNGSPCSQSPVAISTDTISGDTSLEHLAAGASYNCAITVEGVAYCWGYDFVGQLGNGSGPVEDCDGYICSKSPVPVETSSVIGEKRFMQVTASYLHTCGLTVEGGAYCWGADDYGQLGDGDLPVDNCANYPCVHIPREVDTSSITGDKTIVWLTAGDFHTCGLTSEGTAYCWGRDNYGQLGDGGASNDVQVPVAVDTSNIVGESSFVTLSAGLGHTCGLTTDGTAYCWGWDDYLQLGKGSSTPIEDCAGTSCSQKPFAVDTSLITGDKSFVQISAGGFHTCGVTTDETAYCWGTDYQGQLGNGYAISHVYRPASIDTSTIVGETTFAHISAGRIHTCGVTSEGVTYCWGLDGSGQLGDGEAAPIDDCDGLPCSQRPVAVDISSITMD